MWAREKPACKGNTLGSGSLGFRAASLIGKSAHTIHQSGLPNISFNVIISSHFNRTEGRANSNLQPITAVLLSVLLLEVKRKYQNQDIGEEQRVKKSNSLKE
jgi:hypothetical protein